MLVRVACRYLITVETKLKTTWKTLPTLYVRLRYEDNSYTAATNCRSACNLNTSGLVANVTRIGDWCSFKHCAT